MTKCKYCGDVSPGEYKFFVCSKCGKTNEGEIDKIYIDKPSDSLRFMGEKR